MKNLKSDDKNGDISFDSAPLELLEKIESVLKKASEIVGDNNIYSKPNSADSIIRSYVRRISTLEAKLKYVQDDLNKYTNQVKSVDEASQRKESYLEKIKSNNELSSKIEKENEKLQNQIDEITKSLPAGGNDAELFKSEQMIKDAEKDVQNYANDLATFQKEYKLIQQKYKEVEQIGEALSSKAEVVKQDSNESNNLRFSQELLEKREKRMNIQKALDALIAESEAKSNARRIVLAQRKEKLTNQITELKARQQKIAEERNRVSVLKEDIIRLEALIAREELPKQETPENTKTEKAPLNKDRISRLCMMLLTDGPTEELIRSIGSELLWTKDQIDTLLKVSQKGKDPGIGEQWINWLDSVTNDL